MLTKEQMRILGIFKKDIFAKLTFRQIKEQSGQKSNNIVQIALKQFQKQNIIKTQKTGDVTAYSLNMDNNLAPAYVNLINEIEISENKKLPKSVLKEIQNRILKHSEFFILIVFGSHAEGKASEKSDLDIAVIAETERSRKEIIPYMETVKRREITSIDYHVFTRKEFLEMLEIDQQNAGKEIYRKNIIYYGLIEYYNLIRGAKI